MNYFYDIISNRLVWKSLCTSQLFLTLWILYLSLYKVGQTFLWFQWCVVILYTCTNSITKDLQGYSLT